MHPKKFSSPSIPHVQILQPQSHVISNKSSSAINIPFPVDCSIGPTNLRRNVKKVPRRFRESAPIVLTDLNDDSLKNEKELNEILDQISQPMEIIYLIKNPDPDSTSSKNHFIPIDFNYRGRLNYEKYIEAIERLTKLLSNNIVITTYSPQVTDRLFDILCVHLFHRIPPVPSKFKQSMFPTSLNLSNWQSLQLIYKLMNNIILKQYKSIPPRFCEKNINVKFIKRIIKNYQSPDLNEQKAVSDLLQIINDQYINLQQNIIQELKTAIHLFLTGCSQFNGISNILSLLENCMRPILIQNGSKMNQKSDGDNLSICIQDTFENIIKPLFLSDSLHEFYVPLSTIVTSFYNYNSNYIFEILTLLLNHWPILCPSKQFIYINLLSNIFSNHQFFENSDSRLVSIIPKIITKLLQCLESPYFEVAHGTAQILCEPSFLNLFDEREIQNPDGSISILHPDIGVFIEPLEKLKSHWNDELQCKANETLSIISGLKKSKEIKEKEINHLDQWESIANQAAQNDSTIISSDILKTIDVNYCS